MDATEAIVTLLSASLVRRRERYVEFATRPQARRKLLSEFYHQLGACFSSAHIVSGIPDAAWASQAYRYSPVGYEFGTPCGSLSDAYASIDQATLLVTDDGRFGVFTEEGCMGGPILICAEPAA